MNVSKVPIIVHGALHKRIVTKRVPHVCCNEISTASHAMCRRLGQHSIHKTPAQAAYIRAAESKMLQECRGASCMSNKILKCMLSGATLITVG